MSIIAVTGFPQKFTTKDVMKQLAKPIYGNFEALNFVLPKGAKKAKNKDKNMTKTCYLRLSEKLDPVRVVEKINDFTFRTKRQYKAHIPDKIPDIPLGTKPKPLPKRIRTALCIPDDHSYDQILYYTTEEILTEMQAKYPGLFNVSQKTGHKLLRELGKKINIRAKELADSSEEASQSCFTLSRAYRRAHPHFGDFQLVLSTLHALQDAVGVPRTQLQETDISSLPPGPPTLNLSPDKIKSICAKKTTHIANQMKEHINKLPSEILDTDSEEELARKQVRSELKKFSPYLYLIVDQVLRKHFMPADGPFYRLRIYGEPFLPSKEIMKSFLHKFKPVHITRSTRMYNLLKFNVSPVQYPVIMAMNGTVLNGAKLIIRPSDLAHYEYKQNIDNSGEQETDQLEEMPMDQDELVNWDEEL